MTADIHLKSWKDKDYTDDNIPLKLYETIQALNQMADYARDNNIKNIFILGDVNDTKSIISVSAVALFMEYLSKNSDLNYHIIHGNHDIAISQGKKISSIELFKNFKNVKIYLKPEIITLDGVKISIVPYSKILEEDIIGLHRDDPSCKILFGHFGLSDAKLETDISVACKLDSKALFEYYDYIFLGHYHKPQEIFNSAGNKFVIYCGSPVPFRSSEKFDEKRFVEFDLNTFKTHFIPTEGYRKYVEYVIRNANELELYKDSIKKDIENKNFVVIRKDKNLDISKYIDINDLYSIYDILEKDEIYEVNRGITSSMSLKDIMKKYMEIENLDESVREKYLSHAEEVLRNFSFMK